jgi:hypothetical protein
VAGGRSLQHLNGFCSLWRTSGPAQLCLELVLVFSAVVDVTDVTIRLRKAVGTCDIVTFMFLSLFLGIMSESSYTPYLNS